MYGIAVVVFLMVCLGLVISILLQSAKGEGLAGAFGGSSLTGTVFGGRGAATFLTRATTYLGAAFMLMAIALSFLHPTTGQSSLQGTSAVEEAARQGQIPATPVPGGQTPPPAATDQPADAATPIEQLFDDAAQQPQADPPAAGDTAK